MLPVCAKCKIFFHPKKNGIYFEEGMPVVHSTDSVEETIWESYKLWSGDLYECRGCGAEIVVGFGAQPIEINNHEGYKERVASFESEFMVIDDE